MPQKQVRHEAVRFDTMTEIDSTVTHCFNFKLRDPCSHWMSGESSPSSHAKKHGQNGWKVLEVKA